MILFLIFKKYQVVGLGMIWVIIMGLEFWGVNWRKMFFEINTFGKEIKIFLI